MSDKSTVTLGQAIETVLGQVQEPIAMDEFAKRVLAIYPSKAKDPRTALRSNLRSEHIGKTVAFLDRHTLVPLQVSMRGVRFRIALTRQEANRGLLIIDPAFERFRPQGFPPHTMQLLDTDGRPLNVRVVTLKHHVKGPLGSFTRELPAFDLGDWFRTHKVRRQDSILVTIMDWEHGRFRLEHEPAGQRRQQEIDRQNQELADALFDMLDAASSEQLYAYRAIPTAYTCLSDPRGYPGDHWVEVIDHDARMRCDGFAIHYSDFRSPLEAMLRSAIPDDRRRPEEPATPEQTQQVYRFKAALWHRPGLWRRLEIQGGQSLADFDTILRDAFQHDTFDHMGGFWKLVRRGKSRRVRELELGTINPFGEGDSAGMHVAGIGLKAGDELKYVYDFGDWIEHRLILEEITAPEAEAMYPRVVAQNKPRYRYCPTCKDAGDKTVATWICLECSNAQQQHVVMCEACLADEHEDHYVEEVLY